MNRRLFKRLSPALDHNQIANLYFGVSFLLLSGMVNETELPGIDVTLEGTYEALVENIHQTPFLFAPFAYAAQDVLNHAGLEQNNLAMKLMQEIVKTGSSWCEEWGKKPNMDCADMALKNLKTAIRIHETRLRRELEQNGGNGVIQ